jgi:two-component system, sensor histidine kinase RegB
MMPRAPSSPPSTLPLPLLLPSPQTARNTGAPRAQLGEALEAPTEASSRILMRWLVGLRWAVFLLLAASLPFGERLLGFHVRYAVALPVVALIVVFNARTGRRLTSGAPVTHGAVAAGVALDLVAIGALLAASGGAANPFSAVFFVHVALAASLLPARTTFALAALAACLFAALFALPSGGCCPHHPEGGAFSAHLYGMWLAFVIAAGLVAYFLTRVRGALDDRERVIAELRRKAEANARFAALGTLAAGTAHELATPLSTIAVLAGELTGSEPESSTSARAIGAEVERCRGILTRMQAGGALGREGASRAALGPAVRRGVETWMRAHPGVAVELAADACGDADVGLSAADVEAMLCALLDNALYATEEAASAAAITVTVRAEGPAAQVVVEDLGAGIAPELEGRLGEPFLTTKEPGRGMGLGLYLIRTLLARAAGSLEATPRTPRGTRVTLSIAVAGA